MERARTQAGLRLKRQALREAQFEDEERRRRSMSPLESASEDRAAELEARVRANSPTLTVAGTPLPLVFPVDPVGRWSYTARARVSPDKHIFADALHAEVNLVAGLTPYHGVSPIFTGPDGVPPGPQDQLRTLVDTMQRCM
eukprot:4793891-Pleurochrysis_carterae.AAC.2